ncbi:MAG: hypothetical protein C4519_12810 [Desulfobacteraceae bacterium]|nr:MAG: hypothetical protein C4519_12810 [Desulfobacteraceae bacterium]
MPPNHSRNTYDFLRVGIIAMAMVLWSVAAASGHGGKSHGDSDFTHLQALQKAVQLYDQLVSQGKLEEGWETDLTQVRVSSRRASGKMQTVVSFERSRGNNTTVYIFFDADGRYAGSNFTGE